MSSDSFDGTGVPGLDDELWDEPADPFADPLSVNLFTQEIENVDTSDWDVDSDSLWGDAATDAVTDVGGGSFDIDLPG